VVPVYCLDQRTATHAYSVGHRFSERPIVARFFLASASSRVALGWPGTLSLLLYDMTAKNGRCDGSRHTSCVLNSTYQPNWCEDEVLTQPWSPRGHLHVTRLCDDDYDSLFFKVVSNQSAKRKQTAFNNTESLHLSPPHPPTSQRLS